MGPKSPEKSITPDTVDVFAFAGASRGVSFAKFILENHIENLYLKPW